VAGIVGPLLAGGIAAAAGGAAGWRWSFIALSVPSVIAGLYALRLREPARGAHERRSLGTEASDETSDAPQIPLGTAVRRLNQIKTLRYLYVGIGVLGFGLIAGGTLLSLYFEEQWNVGELGRGAIFSIMGIGTAVGLVVGGVGGDRLFRRDPAWPVFLVGASIVGYSLVTAGAIWMPALWMVVTVLVISLIGVGAATAPLRQIVAAVAPPELRSLAFALLGIYIALYGGFAGGIIFGAISDATSPRVALTFLVVPGAIGGSLMAYGARFVRKDIALVVADIKETQRAVERRKLRARNLLEVRNIDFSYGPVQVLFDVSLDVPEGEIIALLGTNGAGKSTLLRLVTGLDHPQRGSIRFDGHDITYLEAEQLLDLGIAQMPGGKAVFPGLTVGENLKVGAFSFRKDAKRITAEIDHVQAWFPVLGERRNQLASTLSGGEQQMLALGKAFLTRPRLLCIDELALGLAPQVVGSLLEIAREMHRQGTTIVIVEQSLNVACSIATTAVFLEKGHVRFTGPALQLLERPDLARSIFLEGATR
jgi:ABC-type branched-subunit amino acid transport system ATPase component